MTTDKTQEAQPQEIDSEWRRLALQFDGHRMQAIWHLKAMLSDPQAHAAEASKFLAAGPLSGEEVLARRIAAVAAQPSQAKPQDAGQAREQAIAKLIAAFSKYGNAIGMHSRATTTEAVTEFDAAIADLLAVPAIRDEWRSVVQGLITVASTAYSAMDNTEECADGTYILEAMEARDLVLALDTLDDLPDDKPNYTLSGPGKAEWALRDLLAAPKETEKVAIDALKAADKLFREVLPKFNWGSAFLDADAIRQLNETPGLVSKALKSKGESK